MGFRDTLRSLTPSFLLDWYRGKKKDAVRKSLDEQRKSGKGRTKADLIEQLTGMGIVPGDTLLVHSSLSRIGYVEGGPQAVVDALLEVVGPAGHILMPNSPNAGYQLEYIRDLTVFDVLHDSSKLGAITEVFRKTPGAVRSASVTEPVSCVGPDAIWFTEGHFGQLTPYNEQSPFYKVAQRGGKILYIGVTLANAGTSLHLLEDAVTDFKFPVYHPDIFPVKIRLEDGTEKHTVTKVHNPEWSAKRRCDELIPVFRENGVLTDHFFGDAPTLLLEAKFMLDTMIRLYNEKGVTMYTPTGS